MFPYNIHFSPFPPSQFDDLCEEIRIMESWILIHEFVNIFIHDHDNFMIQWYFIVEIDISIHDLTNIKTNVCYTNNIEYKVYECIVYSKFKKAQFGIITLRRFIRFWLSSTKMQNTMKVVLLRKNSWGFKNPNPHLKKISWIFKNAVRNQRG